MSQETILRCGGACGAELVTTDPVNRRAVYLCPDCLKAEMRRIDQRIDQRISQEDQ